MSRTLVKTAFFLLLAGFYSNVKADAGFQKFSCHTDGREKVNSLGLYGTLKGDFTVSTTLVAGHLVRTLSVEQIAVKIYDGKGPKADLYWSAEKARWAISENTKAKKLKYSKWVRFDALAVKDGVIDPKGTLGEKLYGNSYFLVSPEIFSTGKGDVKLFLGSVNDSSYAVFDLEECD